MGSETHSATYVNKKEPHTKQQYVCFARTHMNKKILIKHVRLVASGRGGRGTCLETADKGEKLIQ